MEGKERVEKCKKMRERERCERIKKMWISSCLKHIFNNRINISINILSKICLLDVASSTKLTAWYGQIKPKFNTIIISSQRLTEITSKFTSVMLRNEAGTVSDNLGNIFPHFTTHVTCNNSKAGSAAGFWQYFQMNDKF